MFIGTKALWDMVWWWTRITSTDPQSAPLCPRMVSKFHFSGIISTGFLGKEKQEYNVQWWNRYFKVFHMEEITLLPKLGILWSFRNAKWNVQARFELAKKVLDLNHVGETYDSGFTRVLWYFICLVPVLSLKHKEQAAEQEKKYNLMLHLVCCRGIIYLCIAYLPPIWFAMTCKGTFVFHSQGIQAELIEQLNYQVMEIKNLIRIGGFSNLAPFSFWLPIM